MLKRIIQLSVLGIFLSSCSIFQRPVTTMPAVNVRRYAGAWYEIAALPSPFQRNCYCNQVNYHYMGKTMQVVSTCHISSPAGRVKTRKLKATLIKGANGSKAEAILLWPFIKAQYWIIFVDKNYQYALAGTPGRSHLWLLSRTRTMPKKTFEKLMKKAKKEGYKTNQVKKINQSCINDNK